VHVVAGRFQPLCAFFGGVVAQETVKFTGKYTPLDGWLYLDSLNSLPEELDAADTKLEAGGSRYDHHVTLFGRTFFERLRKLKLFLVGSGALGCEFLKAFSLMGIASAEGGQVTVTDMDTIEVRAAAYFGWMGGNATTKKNNGCCLRHGCLCCAHPC